ncbi:MULTISPECIES: CidA/LrgA family protein [unclassified Pseudoalteromonas]|uniref:CidA/LrgA family protein n=1 Tax=unclassified Pseudoalteromonas TaxID=194690 RepID=UPI001108ECED|nr:MULTISPECIES: CidA/LrgA family protein [unclassified Pseudoalteromonas]TMN72262.1 CidA/LrgA family protein [Pseudoalteromonas sp. S1727]BDF95179.1 hypothetical protein KAN5_20170 [Pseudoalteromonas sp. KAN5]
MDVKTSLPIKLLPYLISSTLIVGCLAVAKLIMNWLQGSFPAPLLGMLILLTLLLTKTVKEQHIAPSAKPLLNFMPLFFIPAGVGFIEHLELIKQQWQFLTATLILVPLTSLLLIAFVIGLFKGRAEHG